MRRFLGSIAVLLLGPFGPAAWAADLSGVVVADSDGAALADIEVSLYVPSGDGWTFSAFTNTDAQGSYAFAGIEGGDYRLLFRDWSQVYAFEYSGDSTTLEGAATIAVTGSTTYDAALLDAGRISGELLDPSGAPVSSGFVAVFENQVPLGNVLFIQQLNAGVSTYDIGGLATGEYIARFSGQVDGQGRLEFFDNTPDVAFATPISVTAGQTTAIDVVLGESSGLDLTGTVSDPTGAPLDSIEVSIYRWTGLEWDYLDYVETPADGSYAFNDLPAGDYRVLFRDWSGVHAFQYWPDGTTLNDGQTVVLDDSSQIVDATMRAAGRITGSLTDPAGRPLFNPLIAVFGTWDPGQVLFVQQPTGSDYDIGGLPTGDYLVRFTGQQSNNRSYLEYYDDAPDAQSAVPVAVQVGEASTGIDAVMGLGPGGTIRGRLRDRYGEELDIARVTALNWNNGQWVEVSSVQAFYQDDDYDYLLDVPAGTYRLRFDGGSFLAPDGQLESEFFPNATSIESASDLTVATGDALTGIDEHLGSYSTGSISGTVADAQGNPAAGIEVLAFDRSLSFLSDQIAVTDVNGDYTVPELWPEEYFLRFYDPTGALGNVWYAGAASPSGAQRVPVAGAVDGIDIALDPAANPPGSISGIVTDEQDQALEGVLVLAYEAPCDFSNETPVCELVGRTETSSDGSYRLRDLTSGEYLVQFSDQGGAYLTRYHLGADSLETATPVTVTAPGVTAGIDASLPEAGSISGVVSNAFGDAFDWLTVSAFRLVDGEYRFERSTTEFDDTEYRITRLPTGTYRVAFTGGGWTGNNDSEFYDDVPDLASATDITVTAGSDTGMIDAVLGAIPGGSISGTVTDGAGQPAAGITVRLYDEDAPEALTLTDAAGQYEFTPLNSGVYFIEFEDSGGTLPGEFYLDVADFERATPILVGDDPISGIDAVLDGAQSTIGGGLISGRVSAAGGQPLEGIRVSCEPAEGGAFDRLPCFGTTDAAGEYAIGGRLLSGDYRLRFSDPDRTYATEYFDDRILRQDADPVAVTVGSETAGVDVEMAVGASIEGTVTRVEGGFYPITSISLLRQHPGSGDWTFVSGRTQLDDGNYRIDGVPAGTYRVQFRGSSLAGIQNPDIEFHDDSPDLDGASDVALNAGQVTTGIDAVLGDLEEDGQAANVDFNSSILGWTTSDETAVAFSESDVFASPDSGSLEVSAGRTVNVSQCTAIDGRQNVRAVASHRSGDTAGLELWVRSYAQHACSGAALEEARVATGSTTVNWERLSGTTTTPPGTLTVRIELRVMAGSQPVQIDDLDLRLLREFGLFADRFE